MIQLSDEAATAALAFAHGVIEAGLGEGPEPEQPTHPDLEMNVFDVTAILRMTELRARVPLASTAPRTPVRHTPRR